MEELHSSVQQYLQSIFGKSSKVSYVGGKGRSIVPVLK